MSGICGLIALDGCPIGSAEIESMTTAMSKRGPDGGATLVEGPVAFGFACPSTTGASQVFPLRHGATGCILTGDIRLDNRDELASALGRQAHLCSDGELVIESYLRWGPDCVWHLLGDFAFALWDWRRMRLLAARDTAGMRQLVYHLQPGRLFAFATEPAALLATARVPKAINEVRIADFLADLEAADLTSTFHRDIFRLPPAHRLLLEGGRLHSGAYWSLQPGEELKLPSDDAYAEAFLDQFSRSVERRLRGSSPVGAMLSGGLDSSSAVAVASRLQTRAGTGPLPVFSAVGPESGGWTETSMIRCVQRLSGLDPAEIDHRKLAGFADQLLLAIEESQEPFDAHMALIHAVYALARRSGIAAMLDGAASDIVLDHRNVIARLMRQGSFVRAFTEARGERRFRGRAPSTARLLLQSLRTAVLPDWARTGKRRWRHRAEASLRSGSIIEPGFAREVGLADRHEQLEGRAPTIGQRYGEERATIIQHSYVGVGRERYDRVASRHGIEPRDPFLDRQLLEFCVNLPQSQLVSRGWPKFILRNAMNDLLPEEVRWRKGRVHLGALFSEAVERPARRRWLATIVNRRSQLERYVRREVLEGVTSAADRHPAFGTVAHLANWLALQQERRGSP